MMVASVAQNKKQQTTNQNAAKLKAKFYHDKIYALEAKGLRDVASDRII